jgi:hypothetical protein
LYNKDIDGVQHNYIDTTDEKDSVSFNSDRKAIELNKDYVEKWKVIDSRYLTIVIKTIEYLRDLDTKKG